MPSASQRGKQGAAIPYLSTRSLSDWLESVEYISFTVEVSSPVSTVGVTVTHSPSRSKPHGWPTSAKPTPTSPGTASGSLGQREDSA